MPSNNKDTPIDAWYNDSGTQLRIRFTPVRPDLDDFVLWRNKNLREIPPRMEVIRIMGIINESDVKYVALVNLLRNDSRRWSSIFISGQSTVPYHSIRAFSELLMASLPKTDNLILDQCMNSVDSFGCLSTALQQNDDLSNPRLEIRQFPPLSNAEAEALAKGVSRTRRLTLHLDLTGSRQAQEVLFQSLRENLTLRQIDLMHCKLQDGAMATLIHFLQKHPKLKRFKVRSRTSFSDAEMIFFHNWLTSEDCTLKRLEIENYAASQAMLPQSPLDSSTTTNNTSVEVLGLERIHIKSSDLHTFLPTKFLSLVSLKLRGNLITDLSLLFRSVTPNLVELVLANNKISDLTPFATSQNASNLRTLDLAYNKISDISPLCSGNLPKLQDLDLCSNQISNLGPLENGKLSSLRRLVLRSNRISSLKALARQRKLRHLNFAFNGIGGKDMLFFAEQVLPQLMELRYLFVSWGLVTESIPSSSFHIVCSLKAAVTSHSCLEKITILQGLTNLCQEEVDSILALAKLNKKNRLKAECLDRLPKPIPPSLLPNVLEWLRIDAKSEAASSKARALQASTMFAILRGMEFW